MVVHIITQLRENSVKLSLISTITEERHTGKMMKYLLVLVFLYFVCINAGDGKAKKEKEGGKPSGKKIAMRQSGDIDITIRSVPVISQPEDWAVYCVQSEEVELREAEPDLVLSSGGQTL